MTLPKDHPEVQDLLKQLQYQHELISQTSSLAGYPNIENLRIELYQRGWNTRLADDGVTVTLVPREKSIYNRPSLDEGQI